MQSDRDASLGQAIRQFRRAKGLTLRDLAERVGVSHQMIHKYEAGRANPSAERLFRLATALGVNVGDIMGGEVTDLSEAEMISAYRDLSIGEKRALMILIFTLAGKDRKHAHDPAQ